MSEIKRTWPKGWGPTIPAADENDGGRGVWVVLGVLVLTLTGAGLSWVAAIAIVAGGYFALASGLAAHEHKLAAKPASSRVEDAEDPLAKVLQHTARLGSGTYLGITHDGTWRLSAPERAVLLLGPPRSGKTSAIIVPAVVAHRGPVVSTSTKPDVLQSTITVRSQTGIVWAFDPTGSGHRPEAFELRWSPIPASRTWDGALLMARAMVTGSSVGAGTTESTHWSRRATALLAPLLHAAALDIATVVDWVMRHELDQPGTTLTHAGADLASSALIGLQNTEQRERSSIFSAAADALDAYTSHAALAAAASPNFDPDRFVRSGGTIYIHAPADQQQLAAPLVCGLLSEIRAATYRAQHEGALSERVLFALDEVANIAPLAELPAIASEGGGQGLQLLASLQDLSQARARWGPAAEGFLTLFGSKLLLGGIADTRTLEAVSTAIGEYDRPVESVTRSPSPNSMLFHRTTSTVTTQRQRTLPPGDIAHIPAGHGLHLDGVQWELLTLTPAHRTEPWRTLMQTAPAAAPTSSEATLERQVR
jgi:type IV secretion system protein VirD4